MKFDVERRIIAGSSIIIVILVVLSLLFYYSTKKYREASKELTESYKFSYHSEQVLTLLIDIETGTRGYLVAKDRSFLEPYLKAREKIKSHILHLKTLTHAVPLHSMQCDTLLDLSRKRLEISSSIISSFEKEGYISERVKSQLQIGKKVTDDFRTVVARLHTSKFASLEKNTEATQKSTLVFTTTIDCLLFIVISAICSTCVILIYHLRTREKNETTIKRNWQLLQSVLDNAPLILYIKDLEGRYKLVNKNFANYFNAAPIELVNKSTYELVNEESKEKIREQDEYVLKKDKPIEFAETLEYNGSRHTNINLKFPLKDENNNTYAICGIVTDISERKRLERMLLYQSYMIDNASDAIIATDLDHNITVWNKAAGELYGIKEEDALGQPFFDLILFSKTQRNLGEVIKEHLYSHNEWRGELVFKSKSKGEIAISSSSSFIKNHEEIPIGILSINRNITDQKKQEAAIKQLNTELEAFSYSVSHDLRAPLRSISGYSQILLEDYQDKLDEEGKRVTNTIIRNANRMGILIDDLLHFSRIGRKDLNKQLLNMQDVFEFALQEVEHKEGFKNVNFQIALLGQAYGDINTLKQVWINLLDNAIKYSKKVAKPTIQVGTESTIFEDVFWIKDNGVGFDMQYYNKLFGVFQRLHSDDEFEGTGVGLALVNRIIVKHGGKIWAESKFNGGATFFFSLPKPAKE